MISYGTGIALAAPIGGGPVQQFAQLQDISFDITFTEKELKGRSQWPLGVARGGAKGSLKAKSATIQSSILAYLFFGAVPISGMQLAAIQEVGTIPADTAYTVEVANHATFQQDVGVSFAITGVALTKVTSDVATGEYMVDEDTGIYTFAVADKSLGVLISYLYSGGDGFEIPITNAAMGTTPVFELFLNGGVASGATKFMTAHFKQCTSSKLSLPQKNEDFVISELDITIMDPGDGNIGSLSFAE